MKLHIATISAISTLIYQLNISRDFYSKILMLIPDYTGLIKPLFKQKDIFIHKLMDEYKRIANIDYKLTETFTNHFAHFDQLDALSRCLEIEEKLINLYSATLNEDILWEVLPVIAKQLNFLQDSHKELAAFVGYHNEERGISNFDYANHSGLSL